MRRLCSALITIAAGRIHFGVAVPGGAQPLVRDGRLTLLAVGPQRSPLFPDVPAINEFIPNFSREGSQTLFAPAATPRAVLDQLSCEVGRVLELKDVRERLQNMGFHIAHTPPEETDRLFRVDIQSFTWQLQALELKAQ